MNVLVTGGAGFIGSHLVDRLIKDGHQVTVVDKSKANIRRNLGVEDAGFDRAGLRTYHCDINDIHSLSNLGQFDWIVHCAAMADIVPSIENPVEYHNSNVNGTVSVLEFAKKHPIKKFIYVASSSCYGNTAKVPTQETEKIDCKYPYALSKWIGEEYVMHWARVYGLPAISLRLFNVYGPRSRTTGAYGAVFGVFLKQKLDGKPYTVVGSGSQSRDFIYVDDVVDAFILALNSDKKGQVYNVGTGQHVSIRNLINLLGSTNGIEYSPERPGEPDITMAWTAKIQQDLRFFPKTTFQQGVKKMLEHIKDYADAPLWTKEKINVATKVWFERLGDQNERQLR